MSYLISVGSSNATDNLNSSFIYQLPHTGTTMLQNAEMAVQSVIFYHSIFNIDQARYGNGQLTISMPTGSTTQAINIQIKDGLYEISDLNAYIRSKLAEAGACLYDADGNQVHFIQLVANQTYYSCQLDLAAIPNTLGSYVRPPTGLYSLSGTGLPSTAKTGTITFGSGFGDLIGLEAGTYPSTPSMSAYVKLSTKIPMVNPTTSYTLTCSLIRNPFTNPSNQLCTWTKGNTLIGKPIEYTPPEHSWIDITSGNYSEIHFGIVDQLGRRLNIREPSVTINVLIRQKNKSE